METILLVANIASEKNCAEILMSIDKITIFI